MKIARVLASSAAAAVLTLTPQAAMAADYGEVAPNEGRPPVAGAPAGEVAGVEASAGALPSTGSTLLDTVIAGAGVLLVAGGGATIVASRRRQHA